MRGYLITFEGCDGSGKTTVAERTFEILKSNGLDVVSTREPGGVPIAEQIRAVILDGKNTAMDIRTEVLLFAASRRQHLVEKVLPALKAGKIVLSDRFVDSSLAYQGYARGAGIEPVRRINDYAIEGTWPDITYFLDCEPEVCLKRIHSDSAHEENRLDLEKIAFHNRVYEGFKMLAEMFPERIVTIDGHRTIEEEAVEIAADIQKRISGGCSD